MENLRSKPFDKEKVNKMAAEYTTASKERKEEIYNELRVPARMLAGRSIRNVSKSSRVDMEDVWQTVDIQIWKSLEQFKPEKGSWSTYVVKCIIFELYAEVNKMGTPFSIPRNKENYARVYGSKESRHRYVDTVNVGQYTDSEEDKRVFEMQDSSVNVQDEAERSVLLPKEKELAEKYLSLVSPKAREMIIRRDIDGQKVGQIAKDFHCCRQNVYVIIDKAYDIIRQYESEQNLLNSIRG